MDLEWGGGEQLKLQLSILWVKLNSDTKASNLESHHKILCFGNKISYSFFNNKKVSIPYEL